MNPETPTPTCRPMAHEPFAMHIEMISEFSDFSCFIKWCENNNIIELANQTIPKEYDFSTWGNNEITLKNCTITLNQLQQINQLTNKIIIIENCRINISMDEILEQLKGSNPDILTTAFDDSSEFTSKLLEELDPLTSEHEAHDRQESEGDEPANAEHIPSIDRTLRKFTLDDTQEHRSDALNTLRQICVNLYKLTLNLKDCGQNQKITLINTIIQLRMQIYKTNWSKVVSNPVADTEVILLDNILLDVHDILLAREHLKAIYLKEENHEEAVKCFAESVDLLTNLTKNINSQQYNQAVERLKNKIGQNDTDKFNIGCRLTSKDEMCSGYCCQLATLTASISNSPKRSGDRRRQPDTNESRLGVPIPEQYKSLAKAAKQLEEREDEILPRAGYLDSNRLPKEVQPEKDVKYKINQQEFLILLRKAPSAIIGLDLRDVNLPTIFKTNKVNITAHLAFIHCTINKTQQDYITETLPNDSNFTSAGQIVLKGCTIIEPQKEKKGTTARKYPELTIFNSPNGASTSLKRPHNERTIDEISRAIIKKILEHPAPSEQLRIESLQLLDINLDFSRLQLICEKLIESLEENSSANEMNYNCLILTNVTELLQKINNQQPISRPRHAATSSSH